jgi:hypothetical protein
MLNGFEYHSRPLQNNRWYFSQLKRMIQETFF